MRSVEMFPVSFLILFKYFIFNISNLCLGSLFFSVSLAGGAPIWLILFSRTTFQFSSVQSLSRVRLFSTPWIAARQASLSITNSRSSLRLIHRVIDAIQPSHPLSPLLILSSIPPSIRVFSNESALHMRCPRTGVSALASVLPKKSQGWSPSEWTGWITLQSKGLSRVFSNTTVQKHQFFGTQPSSQSNSHIQTWPHEKP